MSDASALYDKGNYKRALNTINSYIDDYPRDTLGLRMRRIIRQRLASRHLKRAYTLISEGLQERASEELDQAADYHSEFTSRVEKEYSQLLEEYSPRQAADRIIHLLLTQRKPSPGEVNEVKREIRERVLGKLGEEEFRDIQQLRQRVEELTSEKNWSHAVKIISQFIADNPALQEARVLLSEIHHRAAEYFYEKAMEYARKEESSKALEKAEEAKNYDEEYFVSRLEDEMEQARLLLSMERESEARKKLLSLAALQQEGIKPELFLKLLDEDDDSQIMSLAREYYRQQNYKDAAVMFDVLRVQKPENNEARLYYHLSMARVNIRRQNLEKVRGHLINALQISPGEGEAIEIFDRLQEVMDVMGISL